MLRHVLPRVGYAAVGLLYAEAFMSTWCVWAALTSVLTYHVVPGRLSAKDLMDALGA